MSSNHSSNRALQQIPADTPTSEARSLWEMSLNLDHVVSLLHSVGIFNMPFNLTTWDRRLYFSSEGRRAADFVALGWD
jgi:hypothetical protein